MKALLQRWLNKAGYEAVNFRAGTNPRDLEIVASVANRTLVGPLRLLSVIEAVEYVVKNRIPGAIVECGVWRGGCLLAASKKLLQLSALAPIWGYDLFVESDFDDVRRAITEVHPPNLLTLVPGDVLKTLPAKAPRQIAVLRLDTNTYDSTMHELRHLYPLLAPGGVLLLDDYGRWPCFREAVRRYFHGRLPFLCRIDYTGRLTIKK